ncbi:unnamed protein product [Caenorhabditis bovis]|uniref:Lipase n=1 Tax=Caenorhabditis bovis TaxID=2654633 RepID=A0A8S1E893_9PELO|nr:unnamed protein product [Caenorhabditis bovis]
MTIFGFIQLLWLVAISRASDPEDNMSVAQIIAHHGYPVERHFVKTADGYINEVQRIPHGHRNVRPCAKRPVVYCMHGLFSSGAQFVMNLPSQSTAFVMADAGFDVWIGNLRGTEYGMNHTTLSIFSQHFWNFSLYDHSHHDLKSQVEYILNVTDQPSLFYIGHSQGTTVMFMRLAEADAQWQKKIRTFYGLAPSAGFKTPFYPFVLLEIPAIQDIIQFALDGKLGIFPIFLPKPFQVALSKLCAIPGVNQICGLILSASDGIERLGQVNTTRLPLFLRHFPSRTSTLNLLHWTQAFKYHGLRHLDLGRERNMRLYGKPEAPSFDLSNIVTPTILYYSSDDNIADARDAVEVILKRMGPGLKQSIKIDHFSHLDYAIGLRATDAIYKPIVYSMYEDINKNGC